MKNFIVLIALIIGSYLHGNCQNASKISEVKIKTSAVCGMCKQKIEKELAFEKGVKDVNLDLTTKIVTIKYRTDKTNAEKLKNAIIRIGYDADELPAENSAYEKLSPCCKKDAPTHK